jgi:oligopeptide/dipeptide ABC transporter ATP-binding protein
LSVVSEPIIELDDVGFAYASGPPWSRSHVAAVRGVSISIDRGTTIGLVGESGSGKSTVGRMCLGLLRPMQGRVLFDGQSLVNWRRRELRGKLAAVLQHPQWSLNPRLHVGVSVAEPLVIDGGHTRAERRAKVAEMLELVGLDASLADRYPHELSGGQRQRVAIARALITHPRFIVFDEAVSSLDVSIQAQILNLVKRLQADVGFAALFISHDLAAVRYVATRIAVMYSGEIVEFASAAHFYAETQHPYTRALQRASETSSDKTFDLRGTPDDVATAGCPLHLRCPMTVERCRVEKPQLRPVTDGFVACHRADELTAAT